MRGGRSDPVLFSGDSLPDGQLPPTPPANQGALRADDDPDFEVAAWAAGDAVTGQACRDHLPGLHGPDGLTTAEQLG